MGDLTVTDEEDNEYVVDEDDLTETTTVRFIDDVGGSMVSTGTEFTITTDTNHDGQYGDFAVRNEDLDDNAHAEFYDFCDIEVVDE